MNKNKKVPGKEMEEDKKFPLPIYDKEEDIYQQATEEPLRDEENSNSRNHTPQPPSSVDDLDIPGTELDDADEAIGEEDEENNYYSLGGDNHDDLEESKD